MKTLKQLRARAHQLGLDIRPSKWTRLRADLEGSTRKQFDVVVGFAKRPRHVVSTALLVKEIPRALDDFAEGRVQF